ncbi:VPA1262 family protein [Aeromonas dhakensis]|uniref:VPA1262 family protein n=1 Tax=Aeromonas dhakensis TaxID=196024 RepID=UPI0038F5F50A
MTSTLDKLLNDCRLARLFSSESRPCALQLWVLQLKSEQLTENRVLYGRLLPYNHASNTWSYSDNNNYQPFGQTKVQITKLNLYIESSCCAELLTQFCDGKTISEISDTLNLNCSNKLRDKFGSTTFENNNLVYRPVAYLLNRDANHRQSISSPHGSAGAFSASITRVNKGELFRLGGEYDASLTEMIVKHLNVETGLDFGSIDVTRFGDLELLVFPTLNDLEQNLLSVEWTGSPRALHVCFDSLQVSYFDRFQFHLKIINDNQVIYSTIVSANRNDAGIFEYIYQFGDELQERTDSTELEIFGFQNNQLNEGILCCRWQIGYIREINVQGHVMGQSASPVKFDWLEKATRATMVDRVAAVLKVNRGNPGFANHIGWREVDPWVPVNRELVALFAQIHPPKSEGKFFQRWSTGDGEGRLQFVEWFRALFAKYQQHQIVIFDPYFEAAGLGLVLLCAEIKSNYIVFTSLPKLSKENDVMQAEYEQPLSGRVNNLMASCEHNSHLLKGINIRIYGLKEGRLHDRYILIMGSDGLPIAGFHLSNSFQKAAENYPLLITPIPTDVLLQVEQYKSALVKEALASRPSYNADSPNMRLLFDSTSLPAVPLRYEPLRFLDKCEAGNVLSAWSGEMSLRGLSGDKLRSRMTDLGLLKDNSLALVSGLHNCIDKQFINSQDFVNTWEVLGEVLAHSSSDDRWGRLLESESDFLEYLGQFIELSFDRAHDDKDMELYVVDIWFFRKSVEDLLHSSYRIDNMFHSTKYNVLTWSEFFAVKILWRYRPNHLLNIAETQVSRLQVEPDSSEAIRLSLLSQIVNEISLSAQFEISETQRNCLLTSSLGLFRWMGINAIKRRLETPGGLADVISLLDGFDYSERVRILGWMINHAARDANQSEIFNGLVTALHKGIEAPISACELKDLINSMRGHMKQLAWAEPWLFKDVIYPLLQRSHVTYDNTCEIWMQEMDYMLRPQLKNPFRSFERGREGQTTNIAAFLLANCSPERREASLHMVRDILNRQKRIVLQPLASTSNWGLWDDALRVSLWILAFCRWSEFYLRQRNVTDEQLDRLTRDACNIALVRPLEEWQSEGVNRLGELAAFLAQVDELLNEGNQLSGDLNK